MASGRGPAFRMWPPVAVGVPLVLGLVVSSWVGDPLATSPMTVGLGVAPRRCLRRVERLGPGDRNPLYIGLLVGSAGVGLLLGSVWALAALPLEWALLRWGAVLPEERYLSATFGERYTDYTGRVRRWL